MSGYVRCHGKAEREQALAKLASGPGPKWRAMVEVALDTEDLAGSGLRLEIDGAVATITLIRPERRNAQTPAMWRGAPRVGGTPPGGVPGGGGGGGGPS